MMGRSVIQKGMSFVANVSALVTLKKTHSTVRIYFGRVFNGGLSHVERKEQDNKEMLF